MHRGYIKIWRKIEDSGLFQMHSTLALFMYMLMQAAHKTKKVGTSMGVIELERGQFISGRHKLASALELSEQKVRTCLDNLHSMGIITSKATNKFTIYAIVNYNEYQTTEEITTSQTTSNQPAEQPTNNQQITNKQPTDNQQITTKQELKHLSIKELKPIARSEKKTSLHAVDFDFEKGEFLNINGHLAVWEKAYPAVNITAELNKACVWLVENPKNRKSNYGRFLSNWLSRAQDKAPSSKSTVRGPVF